MVLFDNAPDELMHMFALRDKLLNRSFEEDTEENTQKILEGTKYTSLADLDGYIADCCRDLLGRNRDLSHMLED